MPSATQQLDSVRQRLEALVRARLQAPLSSWHEAEYLRLGKLEEELLRRTQSSRGVLSRAAS